MRTFERAVLADFAITSYKILHPFVSIFAL
jgi:hypothetical protein